MIEAFPLQWPLTKPRTPAAERQRANFGKKTKGEYYTSTKPLTIDQAVTRLFAELSAYTRTNQKWRVPKETIVVSTNIPVKKDGFLYSVKSQPEDVGVALYFTLDGKPYCIPCDKWDRVADNIAAIAAHIGAMRGIERWGCGESFDVYAGFKAIPEKSGGRSCWDILRMEPTKDKEAIQAKYRELARVMHPDGGGTAETFCELQEAREQATSLCN